MSDQPEINVTVQPSSAERQDLAQRLSDAGLPADGASMPDAVSPDSSASPKPSDVQAGVGVLGGFGSRQNQGEFAQTELSERDRENQRDAHSDVLPE